MNRREILPTGRAIAAALAVITLAACGGGGGGGTPLPASATLGPTAGSVASSDGKVTVAVGDNALQAPVTISIVPATPDASTAADPAYVAGTTYAYSAPDIQVPDQVLITIESPAAVGAAEAGTSAATRRKFALALPPGYWPPPTCLVNSPNVLNGMLTAQNILVTTAGTGTDAQCPQSPAPGCIMVFNPNPSVAVCAPSQDVIITPSVAASCPPGYREVTNEAGFAELAAANGLGRVCQRNGNTTPPVLVGAGRTPVAGCTPKGGKFICSAPKLPSGTYSVLWDTEQPPEPTFGLKSTGGGTFIYKDELESGAVFSARIFGGDPHGYGAAEILEVLDWPPGNAALGNLNVRRIWAAPAGAFSGAPVTNYDSGHFDIPWENADLAPGSTGTVTRRFMARVFDKAGNSNLSNPILARQFAVLRVGIESFTVSPSSVQFPGGPVTLSWSVKGATQISIDHGGGTFTVPDNAFAATPGSTTVNVTGTTTFTLTATHPMRTTKTATVTVTLGADATPPSVSLAASPDPVVAPGSTTLTATASDNAGVAKVEFWRGATLVGTDTTAPYTQAVAFTPADIGSVAFTAKAFDAANNSMTSAVVNVMVNADTTPPTVALLANPATVLVPGSTTLQATASDNIGVTKVEFWRSATLLATDTAAPYQAQVDFTAADLGTATFTAKAFDAQNNSTTSTAVNVLVTTPSVGDTYVSPSGDDAGNTTCAQANPCRSIAQAAATAQANKTVWLMNGVYDATTQPVPIAIPAGLTLRALTPGLASVGQGIVLQGSATVVGVVLRRNGLSDWGSIAASAGNVTIDGVKAVGVSTMGSGYPAVLALSGSVHATMTPGNIVDYADQLPPVGQGVSIYATLTGNAWLTVNGGLFGGVALGGADGVNGAFNRGAFNLTGSSRLDLDNVVLNVESSGVFVHGDATQVNLNGSVIHASANVGTGYGIYAAKGAPQVTLVNSTISGFDNSYSHGSVGLNVGTFAQPGVALTLSTTNSSITGNNVGVYLADGGSSPSSLAWTGTNTTIAINTHGGVVCREACNIDLDGGEISENATNDPAANANMFHGGIWMGLATKTYQLKLRNMIVVDNKSTAGSNASSSSNSGVTMAGNVSSVFDIGTAASPGNNSIQGNTSSAQTSGLNVDVAAGVTVSAVGNTFAPNVQGANAQGKYQLGTAPCGASSCDLTSGAGANYRVTGGTLRLAQ
jgi:hypothetical protein